MKNLSFSLKSTSTRSVNVNPELTVSTAKGLIKINAAAAKLLDVKPGDYLAFVNNEESVREAIKNEDPEIMAWAEETGNSPEDYPVTWGVFKGFMKLDKNGNPIMTAKRLTKDEREQLIQEGQVDEEGNVIAPEVPAYVGSKLGSVTGEATYSNMFMSDTANWAELGGNNDYNIVFDVSKDYITSEIRGNEVKIYTLENMREVEKQKRG